MANYRFKAAEIEAMKKNILTHIEHETENKTAWRLRCAIEGQLLCCRPSKREAVRLERELALYEKLTKNDLPNWQDEPTQSATPSETPQISMETAETVNVSAEDEKEAERAENKSKAERMKSKYDITEQLERIRVTFLSLPDWDLEPRLGRMALAEDICKRYLENINQHLGLYDETEFCRYSDLKIPQSVYAAPQSPETPQTAECTADTPKPRETARKPQNRGIGRARAARHSGLGAGGYAMLDNASATLAAMSVPRECSTADYW